MPESEQDKLRETGAEQDEIPLTWKLGACAAILLLVIVVAALLTVPLSCLLIDWPQPVCRMLQGVVIPQGEKGE
jgi:hypothetical protein